MNDNNTQHEQTEIHLESLDDDSIKVLITDGYKLLEQRKRERIKKLKEQIKTLAATEELNVSFSDTPRRKRAKKSS